MELSDEEREFKVWDVAAWAGCKAAGAPVGADAKDDPLASESGTAGKSGAEGGDRLMVFSSQPRCSPRLLRVMESNLTIVQDSDRVPPMPRIAK